MKSFVFRELKLHRSFAQRNRVVFLVGVMLLSFPDTLRAGGEAGSAKQDSCAAGGFLSRAAAKSSWLGLIRGGGGGGSPESAFSSADLDFESECRMLEPFFGSTIDTVIVSGNTHTKEITILREMATKQGARLDEGLIRRDIAYLRGLGYFAKVSITAEPACNDTCRILVAIAERPSLFMRVPYPVVNYDFEKGISYGLAWKIKNFRGRAENLGVSFVQRRDREQGASFSWNVPWFLGRRVLFNLGAYAYQRLEEPSGGDDEFIKELRGGSVGFGLPLSRSLVKQLWLKTSLSFEARYSRLAQANLDIGYFRQNFLLTHAELLFDSRANRLSPFDGMLHRVWLRRSASVSGLDQQYIYYGFSDYFYMPVGRERSFIFAIDGDIREGDLTSLEEMKLGGMRDVRGYVNDDLRGTAKVVGTVQYRMKLMGPKFFRLPRIGMFDFTLNGVAFVDSGALTDSILDFRASAFHSTGGVGVEIISPLRDLIRLEVAADAHGQYDYYMTAGTNF